MRFLHCSDVHITLDYTQLPVRKLGWRRWIAMLELTAGGRAEAYREARTCLGRIGEDARALGVDHLLLTGDLTAYALDGEFQGARDALGAWASDRAKMSVIPGNHDRYTPGSLRTQRFERYFGHLLQSDLPEFCREGPFPFVRLLGEEAAVVGLCSARVPRFPGLSYGVMGEAQLAGLREAVADPRLRRRAVLVMVHHAPLNSHGVPDRKSHGLVDGETLLRMLPGPRFAVLHGHIHRRYHHMASAERPHLIGAGSSTERGKEGYWTIDVKDGRIAQVERRTMNQ